MLRSVRESTLVQLVAPFPLGLAASLLATEAREERAERVRDEHAPALPDPLHVRPTNVLFPLLLLRLVQSWLEVLLDSVLPVLNLPPVRGVRVPLRLVRVGLVQLHDSARLCEILRVLLRDFRAHSLQLRDPRLRLAHLHAKLFSFLLLLLPRQCVRFALPRLLWIRGVALALRFGFGDELVQLLESAVALAQLVVEQAQVDGALVGAELEFVGQWLVTRLAPLELECLERVLLLDAEQAVRRVLQGVAVFIAEWRREARERRVSGRPGKGSRTVDSVVAENWSRFVGLRIVVGPLALLALLGRHFFVESEEVLVRLRLLLGLPALLLLLLFAFELVLLVLALDRSARSRRFEDY